MKAQTSIAALAFICDYQGTIRHLLHDAFSLGDCRGQSFTTLVDSGSADKARGFLRTIQTQGGAFGWELNAPVGETIRLLHFAGSQTANGLFIVGTPSRSETNRLYAQWVRINQELPLTEVTDETQAPAPPPGGDGASEPYDDLTRLNNELMTLQREFIKKNVELERLNEQKSRFIGMAAHDLRNPLQVIDAFCQLWLRRSRDTLTEEQVKFISVIKKNSDFMLTLINDLLYVSKVETGTLQLELQATDLTTLISRNLELNSLLAEQKQINLLFKHDESRPEIWLDPPKFEQVLNNLISNAIKFSYPQSTITVSLSRQDNGLLIAVQDQGQGIPGHEFDKLFQPFAKTSVRSTAGEPSTGLGLTITKMMVLAHKGEIWVESQVGHGTTFYVRLPFTQ